MSDITYLPACPTEDSTDCYWDATQPGNGYGNSFVDIDGTAHTLTVPDGHYVLDVALSPAPQGFSVAYQEYPVLPEFTVAGYDPTPVVILAAAGLLASAVIAVTAFVKRA